MRPRALILLNPAAGMGAARRRYARVQPDVERLYRSTLVETDPDRGWCSELDRALDEGVRTFIAAGGDGTVSAVANALVDQRGAIPLEELALGAVGLGSSNDFHKPIRRRVAGIPVRIDRTDAAPRDLVCAQYENEGVLKKQVFVVSGSLGITADANAFFNAGNALLRLLKRFWVSAAILLSAVRTIFRHADVSAVLRMPRGTFPVALSNLSLLKSPHLSGGLSYDTPVDPADGRMAVNLCQDMDRIRVARVLVDLARGRFQGSPGTRSWSTSELQVDLAKAGWLEMDGEVVRARRIRFHVLPERLLACT